jgi:hypothetical protein
MHMYMCVILLIESNECTITHDTQTCDPTHALRFRLDHVGDLSLNLKFSTKVCITPWAYTNLHKFGFRISKLSEIQHNFV